ncbi:hypothetical protein UQW22_01995 [Isoptericola halotolerans]|uniref:hypothetical protein n=1 Tax=Isoptericola halotolerans TaxID=300560 RepID=UPI00388FD50D
MPVARRRAPVAAIVAAAFALLATFVAVPPAAATQNHDDDSKICSKVDGWVKYEEKGGKFVKEAGPADLGVEITQTKDGGEPTQVIVTAPDGYLISDYCVKAGQKTVADQVAPTVTTLTIDGPSGKGISHFAVLLTPDEWDSDWDWDTPRRRARAS